MRRLILSVAALGMVVGMVVAGGASGAQGKRAVGALAGLTVGRPVSLKDEGTVYEVTVMDETLPTGEEVAEVGDNYLVVKDSAGFETRVPITSIKAVIWIPLEK